MPGVNMPRMVQHACLRQAPKWSLATARCRVWEGEREGQALPSTILGSLRRAMEISCPCFLEISDTPEARFSACFSIWFSPSPPPLPQERTPSKKGTNCRVEGREVRCLDAPNVIRSTGGKEI